MFKHAVLGAVLATLFFYTPGHAEDLKPKMIGKWAFVMGSNTGDIEFTDDGAMVWVGAKGPSPRFAMQDDVMTITFPDGNHARAKIVFVNPNEMHQTDLDQGFTIVMKRR